MFMFFAVVTVLKGSKLLEDSGGDVSYYVIIALIVIAFKAAVVLEILAMRRRAKKSLGESNMADGPIIFIFYYTFLRNYIFTCYANL